MPNPFSRTTLLFGKESMERLYRAKVAVFGIGGVGGHCAEALARSGIGRIDLFDDDSVCPSNINRQIIATTRTVGQYKVDVMKERILELNPAASVGAFRLFYSPDTADAIDLSIYDYIVDAVDTVTAKLELICRAAKLNVPIISCMGAANKLDPAAFEVADIFCTSVCPLARVMRTELRKRGIGRLKVVFSREPARKPLGDAMDVLRPECALGEKANLHTDIEQRNTRQKQIPASNAFVPPVAGLIMAGEVVKDLAR